MDRIIEGSRFQSLGAAQLNNLSSKVFLVLTFGGVLRLHGRDYAINYT